MVTQAYPRLVAVTASATALADGMTDAIYVDVAGTMTVTLQGGNEVTLDVIAGALLPIKVTHVTALGGGAEIHALYY